MLPEGFHFRRALHERDAVLDLSHRALDFRVPGVTDHDDAAVLLPHADHFAVNLRDKGAGGVKNPEAPFFRFLLHRNRYAVRGKNKGGAVRHIT